MHFLLPWAFLGLSAAGGLVAAYIMRVRHVRKTVPAVFLWRGASPAAQSGRRRDRLRTPPLFWLELLALVCLALAAAEPAVLRAAPPVPTVVFDLSASMDARLPDGSTPRARAVAALASALRSSAPRAVRLIAEDGLIGMLSPDEAVRRVAAGHDSSRPAPAPFANLVALGAALRAPGGELLAFTDRAPEPGQELPAGMRYRAFGEPVANAAIAFAARAVSEDGRDMLLLRFAHHPSAGGSAATSFSLRAGDGAWKRHDSAAEIFTLELPENTPDVVARLDDDALAADNEVTLRAPDRTPVSVSVEIADEALRANFTRAVTACGAVPADGPGAADVSIRDAAAAPGGAAAKVSLILHPAAAGGAASASTHPIFEGLSFGGIRMPASADGLPGRPLLYAGAGTALAQNGSEFHFAAPEAASPFYRTTVWPGLVYNLLALAKPAGRGGAAPLPDSESDLTALASCDVRTPSGIAPEEAFSFRLLSFHFGFAAVLLMALRMHILRKHQ